MNLVGEGTKCSTELALDSDSTYTVGPLSSPKCDRTPSVRPADAKTPESLSWKESAVMNGTVLVIKTALSWGCLQVNPKPGMASHL